jgi:signal transduction histidine kinase
MNVHLCAILPKETISIVADASSIGRAIGNLIDNAMTYNVEGGSVEVSLKNSELYALVVVRDTGFGISQADCEHIFDRFYRGDKSRASNKLNGFSNTGLGLAIVKSVIAAHNGTVSVVSEVNTGSTFTVTLPLAITNADRKQLAGRC